MPPESAESLTNSWNTPRDALAAIRGLPDAMQTFAANLFDHLDELTRQRLNQEIQQQQQQTTADQTTLQQQIDRLALMIGQLNETLSIPNQRDGR